MNFQLFIQGLIEIILSLFTGLLVFFISFKVFNILTRDIEEIEELKKNNIAVAILVSSFIFGIMLLVKTVISPATDTLSIIINLEEFTFYLMFIFIIRIIFLYFISALFSFIILWFSIILFMILTTKIDEMTQIKKNNISVSLVISILIISITIILLHPFSKLLDGFVPSPMVSSTFKQPFINLPIFINGLIELIIALIASVFIYFLGLKVIDFFFKKVFDEDAELKKNNIAVAVMISSFIFAMMLLIKTAVEPAYNVFENAIENGAEFQGILFSIGQIILFFLLSALFSFIILWLAMKAFMIFTTTIDEIKEIKNKNIAVSIIIAILVLSAALLVEHGLSVLLNSFVKYPEIGRGLLDITNFK
jgi:uncharacterized membrane protein YjfL (UPF0719 family)